MWSALFGSSTPTPTTITKSTPEIVYLIQGTLRVPLELPTQIQKNLPGVRQWVFDQIAWLPLEEDPEYYTFKVFSDNFIYWYSLYDSKRDAEECYGVLMKWDSQQGIFTGVGDTELPPIQLTKPRIEDKVEEIILDNNNKACLPSSIEQKKRLPSKRSRSKK